MFLLFAQRRNILFADVYSAEMALTGVLRQELDFQLYRLDYRLHSA